MATKDQRKETRDEREFPVTSRQRPAGGFEIEKNPLFLRCFFIPPLFFGHFIGTIADK